MNWQGGRIVSIMEQHITFTLPFWQEEMQITIVYAATTPVKRTLLWEVLCSVKCDNPWFTAGVSMCSLVTMEKEEKYLFRRLIVKVLSSGLVIMP